MNAIASYDTNKVSYLSTVPTVYIQKDRCGKNNLYKFNYSATISGKDLCWDFPERILSVTYQANLGYNKDGVPLPFSPVPALDPTSTLDSPEDRGMSVVDLFPNGKLKDVVTPIRGAVLNECNTLIGYEESYVHTQYYYDPVTCTYYTAGSEKLKLFWNSDLMGGLTDALTKANAGFFLADLQAQARSRANQGATKTVWKSRAESLTNFSIG
jgi:hypothetical protein